MPHACWSMYQFHGILYSMQMHVQNIEHINQ